MTGVRAASLDHLVLCVAEVPVTIAFYERVLGMEAREERPGKWSLHFGPNKISLQDAVASPTIAADTIPGTGNFCVLTSATVDEILDHLAREDVDQSPGADPEVAHESDSRNAGSPATSATSICAFCNPPE